MSGAILIASDVHLSADDTELQERFLRFLQGCASASPHPHPRPRPHSLFILGDLFDVWTGDNNDAPFVLQIKQALRELSDAGVSVFIQRGNRDFLLGERFMQDAKCQLLSDEHVITIDEERWLFLHGDQLVDDFAYQCFRYWARPLLRGLHKLLPSWCHPIVARHLRRMSRGGMQSAVIDSARVQTFFERYQCRYMVHGHLHRQEQHQYQARDGGGTQERFSLPDWNDTGGYLQIDDAIQFVRAQ